MGVSTASPQQVFIGAPGIVLFGGVDIGATTEGITVRIIPDPIFTPQVNGIPGMLAQTDYLQAETVEVEVTMLELSKKNLLNILAGSAESPANVFTRTGIRRYPSVMYRDLVIALSGLDDERLVFDFPNVTPTSGLEVSASDDQAAAPAVTFQGRYRFGYPFWRIIRQTTAADLVWVTALPTTIQLKQNQPFSFGFRAVNYDGKPVTYALTAIPAGMTLNTATGNLTGTPTAIEAPETSVLTAADGTTTLTHNITTSVIA